MVDGATRIRIVRERKAAPAPQPVNQPSKPGQKFARIEANCDFSAPDSKKFDVIKDGDSIVDYQNVKISGYLSTFKHVTEADRDGDYVEKGAFAESLPRFMKNPVLLLNHQGGVDNIAGNFTEAKEDASGLRFTAEISNSPTERMRHVRALVAEGRLKTVSMGGRFHYKDDGRGIFKVDLYEGSLVSIPANPDALFSVRECTEAEAKQFQGVSS
jgi:HK97 family phage prohead protease